MKIEDEFVTNKAKLDNLFNSHNINSIENASGIQGNPGNKNEDNITGNHSSIIKIKNTKENPSVKFDIPTAKTEELTNARNLPSKHLLVFKTS